MKKVLAFVLLVVLCFCMVACNNNKYTKIGTSEFSMILPDGYMAVEDDFDEDQIAFYFKDSESIDFDVYQWDKEGKYTLKEEAEYFVSSAEPEVFPTACLCSPSAPTAQPSR